MTGARRDPLLLSIGRRVRFGHVERQLALLPAPQTVLDAGCGDGRLARALLRRWPETRITAIDPDEQELGVARQRSAGQDRIEWLAREIGADDVTGPFDLVVSTDVLEHVGDDEAAFAWLAGRLRPGGRLVLHVPAAGQRHLFGALDEAIAAELEAGTGPHLREGYAPEELRALAERAGLEVVRLGSTFHRRPTRWASDVEGYSGLRQARWLKAATLPALLLGAAVERHAGPAGAGNGNLLVAQRPSMLAA